MRPEPPPRRLPSLGIIARGVSCFRSLGLRAFLRYVLVGRNIGRREPGDLWVIKPVTSRFPLRLRCGTSDIAVFYQVFCVEEYKAITHLRVHTFLDLGANIGLSAAYLLSAFPEAKGLCVEPDRDNLDLCRENLARYGERVLLQEGAVGAESGCCRLDAAAIGDHKEFARTFSRVEDAADAIPIITVRDFLRLAGVERFDLVKIDIEGAETEVFGRATDWLDHVDNLVIEIHGQQARDVVMQALAGYTYVHTVSHELDIFTGLSKKQNPAQPAHD